MPALRILPLAISDLMEIWSYIADDSETNADAFIDELYDTMSNLGHQPAMGREREELAPGIRSFPVRRYVIFYRHVSSAVEVVRVLHGARDLQETFGNERDLS